MRHPIAASWKSLTKAGAAALLIAVSGACKQLVVGGPGPGEPFPTSTAAVQEPVQDDVDADAAFTYPDDGSVVINSGEMRLDRSDLSVPGRGQIQFEMFRRHRSRLDYDGPLGFGWDFTYNEQLAVQPNGDVRRANGLGHVDTWTALGNGRFTAPPGYFGTLTAKTGGYVLRETNGFKRFYDSQGRLRRYRDRVGNTMAFDYDVAGNLVLVTDAYGRPFEFVYARAAGRDRLAILRDFAGREAHYSYDARGDLVAVRSPRVTGTSTGNDHPDGRTEKYTYSSAHANALLNHNLLTVTYPVEVVAGGPAAIRCAYVTFGPALDRIASVTMGGVNATSPIVAGGTATFSWQTINAAVPLGDPEAPRLRASVTERNGNRRDYLIDERAHVIAVRHRTQGLRPNAEPAHYWETRYGYDADGQQTVEVLPEGNRIEYTYDLAGARAAQRNLLEVRRIADIDRGGGEALVTTYTYEPVFNQISTVTDPRGRATTFDPPIGTATPVRYTTRNFYDYQENSAPIPDAVEYGIDLSGIARNLGDLNGDGATDQIAGNHVRTEEPAVLLPAGSNEVRRIASSTQVILTQMHWNERGQGTATIDPEGNRLRLEYYPEDDPDGDGERVPGVLSISPRGYLKASTVDAAPTSPRRTATVLPASLRTVYGYDPVGNIVSLRDPRGVVTTREVNQANEVVVETRGADITQAVANGKLITGEAPFAYRTRYFYDENGRMTSKEVENRAAVSTTAGVGQWVARTYSYDILDNMTSAVQEVDGALAVRTVQHYDENELPTRLIKPEGNEIRTEYDERNLPLRVHHGFGTPAVAVFRYDYDGNGNLLRIVDAEDNDNNGAAETTSYVYDGFDRRAQTTDALGNRTINRYDPASNVVEVRYFAHPPGLPGAPSVLLASTSVDRDELNRAYRFRQSLFLADGFRPTRTVDLRDRDGDGQVITTIEYDALSRKTYMIDDNGDTHRIVYDGGNRPIETIDPLSNRRIRSYDDNNNLQAETSVEISPEGLVPEETFTTRYVYDQLNRPVRITDNAGRTTRLGYDSRDNPTTVSDGVARLLPVDPLGLYPGPINAPGNTTSTHYDGRDLVVRRVTDLRVGGTGDGVIDTGNPANPDGKITVRYAYDGNSRMTRLVDDAGHATGYAYDALNRRTSVTNADSTRYQYGYDRDSNLVTIVDPNGSRIVNVYDVLNRLVRRDITRGAGVMGTTAETYGYDGLSRVTETTDDNGRPGSVHAIERSYDSLSRLLEELQDTQPTSSIWSGDGNRLRLTYPTGRAVEFQYDALDRLKRVTEVSPSRRAAMASSPSSRAGAAAIAEYSWIGEGECCTCGCGSRPLLVSLGNDTRVSFLDDTGALDVGYDAVREVVSLRHFAGATPFIERSYTYNGAYIRTSEQYLERAGRPADTFDLDSAYRITKTSLAADESPESFTTRIDYTLDGVGNRVFVKFAQDAGRGEGFEFRDEYLANEVNEYERAGGGLRTHDANGNLTGDDEYAYAYDYKNRLVEVRRRTDQVLLAHYEYDTFNRRVGKTLHDPGSAIAQRYRYIYDDWNVIEEWGPDPEASRDGALTTYVYVAGIDQPVQMTRSAPGSSTAETFYYHQDARNNVVAITDAAGVVVERTRYEDFGHFSQDSSIDNPYLFQGRRFDRETGLFYFRNRYYSPRSGRFLQRDPLTDPLHHGNQYTFVGNSPVSRVDPYGLIASTITVRPKYITATKSKRTLPSGREVRLKGQTSLYRDPKNSKRGEDPTHNVVPNCRTDASGCPANCARVVADAVTLELWVDIRYPPGDKATAKHEMQHAVQIRTAVEQALAGVADFRSPCKNNQAITRFVTQCRGEYKDKLAGVAKQAALTKDKQLSGGGKSKHAHRNSKAEKEADEAGRREIWPPGVPIPLEFRPMRMTPRGPAVEVDSRIRK